MIKYDLYLEWRIYLVFKINWIKFHLLDRKIFISVAIVKSLENSTPIHNNKILEILEILNRNLKKFNWWGCKHIVVYYAIK